MNSSSSEHPDQLLTQARGGDEHALEQLLGQYRNYLALLARMQVDRQLQAKLDDSDLVQDTLMRAHSDFGRFRGTTEAELMQWLRKIMAYAGANLIRQYFGTKQRNVHLERRIEDELEQSAVGLAKALVAPGSSPSQTFARRERAKLLADALQELPADYREVMILHHLEGLTMADVARRMNRTDDSVQKLWSREIIQLRNSLRDHA